MSEIPEGGKDPSGSRQQRSAAQLVAQILADSPNERLLMALVALLPKSHRAVLGLLAALDGALLHLEHVRALTGLPNAGPILESLRHRHLVTEDDLRYGLSVSLSPSLEAVLESAGWGEKALEYLTRWAEEHAQAPERLAEERPAILTALSWATGAGRWRDALRLGRAFEGALASTRQWGAWQRVLRIGLDAAQRLGDRAAEAWALHQLGVHALSVGDAVAARSRFTEALRLRESLGDHAGAAVTRHNLMQLSHPDRGC